MCLQIRAVGSLSAVVMGIENFLQKQQEQKEPIFRNKRHREQDPGHRCNVWMNALLLQLIFSLASTSVLLSLFRVTPVVQRCWNFRLKKGEVRVRRLYSRRTAQLFCAAVWGIFHKWKTGISSLAQTFTMTKHDHSSPKNRSERAQALSVLICVLTRRLLFKISPEPSS